MKITEYIESGNLELFVAGKLTDSEMKKVALDILNEPLLMQEVIIKQGILKFACYPRYITLQPLQMSQQQNLL